MQNFLSDIPFNCILHLSRVRFPSAFTNCRDVRAKRKFTDSIIRSRKRCSRKTKSRELPLAEIRFDYDAYVGKISALQTPGWSKAAIFPFHSSASSR